MLRPDVLQNMHPRRRAGRSARVALASPCAALCESKRCGEKIVVVQSSCRRCGKPDDGAGTQVSHRGTSRTRMARSKMPTLSVCCRS